MVIDTHILRRLTRVSVRVLGMCDRRNGTNRGTRDGSDRQVSGGWRERAVCDFQQHKPLGVDDTRLTRTTQIKAPIVSTCFGEILSSNTIGRSPSLILEMIR